MKKAVGARRVDAGNLGVWLLCLLVIFWAGSALAAEGAAMHGGKGMAAHHGDGSGKPAAGEEKSRHKMAGHKGGHKGGHHFTPHWAKTLSDEQKRKVDEMHLALDRELVVLKARENLLEKELNALTARDGADRRAIHAKIEELMAVKSAILRQRYDHILEMRAVLTPEQRISYDMAVLRRSGVR